MTNDRRPPLPSISLEEVQQNIARQKEQRERKERESQERVNKALAKREWVSDGGDEKGFEAAWPRIRDEARERAVSERLERQRASFARSFREGF